MTLPTRSSQVQQLTTTAFLFKKPATDSPKVGPSKLDLPTHQRNESDGATDSTRSFIFDTLSISSDDDSADGDNGPSHYFTSTTESGGSTQVVVTPTVTETKSKRTLSWDDSPLPRTRVNSTPALDSPPKSILKKSSFPSHHRAVSEGSTVLSRMNTRSMLPPRHASLHRQRSLDTATGTDSAAFVNDLPLLHSMLKSRQIRYGPTHVRVSQCWNHIGNYHFRRQDYGKALDAYKHSVQCYEVQQQKQLSYPSSSSSSSSLSSSSSSTVVMASESTAAAYSNMGTIYWSTGDFDDAIASLKKSISIHEELGQGSSLLVANCLYQIGLALSLQRDYTGAMEALQQCRSIREGFARHQGCSVSASMDLARVVDAVGKVHFFRGQYEDAMACHQEAMATKRQIVGDTHASVVTSMMNIGVVHKALRNADLAVHTFLAVLEIQKMELVACLNDKQKSRRENLARAAADIGDTLKAIGDLQQQQGQSEKANLTFREALRYYEQYAGLPKNHAKIVGLKWMTQ